MSGIWFLSFRSVPNPDNKVCVISLIGKSGYHTNASKASPLNHILDRDVFKVYIKMHKYAVFYNKTVHITALFLNQMIHLTTIFTRTVIRSLKFIVCSQ